MNKRDGIIKNLFLEHPELNTVPVEKAYDILIESCKLGKKILVCGNGGSASDSEHIVGELMKGFLLKRRLPEIEKQKFSIVEDGLKIADMLQGGIPAISLNSHTALMTAVGNDTSYDMVFAQQVYGYGEKNDVLIGMTTSGSSQNVIYAARAAKAMGLKVIGITGQDAGILESVCDVCLALPSADTYRVQEYTLPVYHALCAMLEEELFGLNIV